LNLAAKDKAVLGKIAYEKKVSIAWVISDAISRYPTEQPQKKGGGNPTNVLPPMLVFSHEPQIYPRDING
jgi:hypothetical protein